MLFIEERNPTGLTMTLKSTIDRYGAIAIAFHWLTALLIVALLALGLNAANAPTDEMRRTLLLPHIALGILTFVLTIARIVWWWFFDRKPAVLPDTPPLFANLARITHLLVYAVIIALAASGIATNLTGGVLEALSTGTPIPPLDDIGPRRAHGLLAWTFMALLVLHIAAALYHHFVRRDRTLARMVGRA